MIDRKFVLSRWGVSFLVEKRRKYKLDVITHFNCLQAFFASFTASVLSSFDGFCCGFVAF